jgi:NOL1/NOP2/sun family putative RNA methylase
MVKLPADFIHKMEQYLGQQANAFFNTYSEPRTHGLRINPLKMVPSDAEMKQLVATFGLSEVPWCPTGFYYEENTRPGKHPYHAAGVYYIQEPSAMSAVERLAPEPGDYVLDLAAAPGGKSTHIAGMLMGEGLLIANEIHPTRAKILSENMERCGVRNGIVTNASPGQLAGKFPLYFDKIMVDAPCSGEGMFRKDPEAADEWSLEHVAMCAGRQADILADAAKMLRPGGTLAYSTCTFSPEENEDVVEAFVKSHPEFTILSMERIWPHLHQGEGHFVAVLHKIAGPERPGTEQHHIYKSETKRTAGTGASKQIKEALNLFESFSADQLPAFKLGDGEPILFGEQLYWLPHGEDARPFRAGMLDGLKVLRPGLHLASVKKNRIEPAHALALALNGREAAQTTTLSAQSTDVHAYLKGEALSGTDRSGWTLVMVDHFSLGWGKASAGQLKNHYPKGLRSLG